MDADDWLEPDAFEMAMQIIQKYNPDIFTYMYVYEGKMLEKHLYSEGLYNEDLIKNQIIPTMMFDAVIGMRRLNPSLACKFLRKDLFLKATEKINDRITLGEDAIVTYPVVCMAKTIFISNAGMYHYRKNEASCTHIFPAERIYEVMAFQNNLSRIFSELGLLEQLQYQIECYVRSFLSMMIKNWFGIERSAISYVFPENILSLSNRVFIYGAGNVGKSYIELCKTRHDVKIVGWADKDYKRINTYGGIRIINPEEIKKMTFDVLVIAVADRDIAMSIKTELIGLGIEKHKIIWTEPVRVG